MIIRKAYKFRLKNSEASEMLLNRFAGHSRFLWNKTLRWCLSLLQQNHKIPRYHEMAFWLGLWKKSDEYGFLSECHSQVLQQKLMDLDRAFGDAFDKMQPGKRLPVFKKKGQHDSFRYNQGFKIHNRHVFLPKIGWVRFFQSQKIEGTAKNVTVNRRGKHWFVSVQVEQEMKEPIHPAKTSIGIDVGIKSFATLSTGEMISPVNSYKKYKIKLGILQRSLSRKKRFSSNWKKQRIHIQTLHSRIANIRNDFLHKQSTDLSKNHAMIVVENLQIRNMSRSAKGDIIHPGKNVRAKSGLNSSILDQGWYEFKRQLKYKQAWQGGIFLEVPARNTSITCAACGHIEKLNRLSQTEFCCTQCGYEENADINAARNIVAAGHAVLACGAGAVARL